MPNDLGPATAAGALRFWRDAAISANASSASMSSESHDVDLQLMQQLANGDDLALNALMRRWQKPLVAFIYRYVGNESDALDLAQETFVRVFESRHRYKQTAKFSTWLFTIASNLCRNFCRWHQRHPNIPLDGLRCGNDGSGSLADTLPDGARNPAEQMERNSTVAAVKEQIQALPHDLKTALLLFEYEDLSYEEIARVLRCSTKAVETRLYRARNLLRRSLASLRPETA